jgi:hypothetical protein
VSKVWTSTGGRVRGGVGYSRGALYYLLRNQIYLGRVPHKQESYDGQHAAIVDQDLWDRVQALLSAKRIRKVRGAAISSRSPLSGLLYDDRGNAMSPTYTKKRDGRRYRYYVSQALLQNDRARAGTVSRIPAKTIEQLVTDEVTRLRTTSPPEMQEGQYPVEDRSLLQEAVDRVVVSKDWVEIRLRTDVADSPTELDEKTEEPSLAEVIRIPVRLARRGPGGCIDAERESSKTSRPDAALVKAICRAHEWLGRFERGEVASHRALARSEHVTPAYVRSVLQLAFLAPELVDAFLDGRRRPRTGLMALLGAGLALSWQGQNQIV